MNLIETIILSIIEGLTEFLPVSSTGHMVVAQGLMDIESTAFVKAFTVIIQLGAILSVVVLYYKRFFLGAETATKNGADTVVISNTPWKQLFQFYLKLFVGILPAVVLGLLFNDWVDEVLGNVNIVIVNLILGGIFMVFMDKIPFKKRDAQISFKQALLIGFWQCIAIFFPGISRSLATIVGGMFCGLKKKQAAEFSFFLAVPTMLGASLLQSYKLYKDYGIEIFSDNAVTLILGIVISFVVALLAIKFFIDYISKNSFKAFGWYRIVFAGSVALLLFWGFSFHV